MSIHVGQVVEVTAGSGLRARMTPNGAQAKDKNGRAIVRPKGYRFRVRAIKSAGGRQWGRAVSLWYALDYVKPAAPAQSNVDRRLRNRHAAVAAARRWTTCRVGMCLATVQTWLGGIHGIPWAKAAWDASKHKHPGDKHPPAGVPVYWSNPRSKYGHIALSVGGSRARSTDWPSRGRVGEGSIDAITRRWGLHYLGWAEDMAPAGRIPS